MNERNGESPETVMECAGYGISEMARKTFEPYSDAMAAAFGEITRVVEETAAAFYDALLSTFNDNPKWWHLYKHARRRRTRKKYKNLLARQMLKAMSKLYPLDTLVGDVVLMGAKGEEIVGFKREAAMQICERLLGWEWTKEELDACTART